MAQYSRKVKLGIRWWYKFDFKAKTYSSECIYLSKNEAKRAEAEKIKELDQQLRQPSQSPILRLSEVMNDRLSQLQAKKGNKYYKISKTYFKLLLQHAKDVFVNTITKDAMEQFLDLQSLRMQEIKKANYTVNAMLRSYKTLFNYAIDTKRIPMINPCKKFLCIRLRRK